MRVTGPFLIHDLSPALYKDQTTWSPLKTGGELMCSGRVSSSCFINDTLRVTLDTKPLHINIWLSNNLINQLVPYNDSYIDVFGSFTFAILNMLLNAKIASFHIYIGVHHTHKNEEKTARLWLRQAVYIPIPLWQKYSERLIKSWWLRKTLSKCNLFSPWYTIVYMEARSPGVKQHIEDGECKTSEDVDFVDRCLSFFPSSFDHWVVYPSSIYGFWLPLWYLETLLKHTEKYFFFENSAFTYKDQTT
jgi:hypothetical protein